MSFRVRVRNVNKNSSNKLYTLITYAPETEQKRL